MIGNVRERAGRRRRCCWRWRWRWRWRALRNDTGVSARAAATGGRNGEHGHDEEKLSKVRTDHRLKESPLLQDAQTLGKVEPCPTSAHAFIPYEVYAA